MHVGRLHILTDFFLQQKYSHADIAEAAIRGGADCIQFRQKYGSLNDILAEANKVAEVCKSASVPLIVNDRLDIAMAVKAYGVHLGQTDMPAHYAVSVAQGRLQIGITAPTIQLAEEAHRAGADYVGFGPVYPTTSKYNPISVQGLGKLQSYCHACKLPVIAIAGITPENCDHVLQAGAHGIAVLSAVALSDNPEQSTRLFGTAIERSLSS